MGETDKEDEIATAAVVQSVQLCGFFPIAEPTEVNYLISKCARSHTQHDDKPLLLLFPIFSFDVVRESCAKRNANCLRPQWQEVKENKYNFIVC